MCGVRRSADGLLCQGDDHSCTMRVLIALGDVQALEDAAIVTYRRAARLGGSGGRPDSAPIPFDDRVRPIMRELGRCVGAILSMVAHGKAVGVDPPHLVTIGRQAGWLTTQHARLRTYTDTESLRRYHDLLAAVAAVERLVDKPADREYIGQCSPRVEAGGSCVQDLYATPGEARATCPRCGLSWDVADRRTTLLAAAEDQVLIAADIARAMTSLTDPVTPERIRKWRHLGRLNPVDSDHSGRPRYRLGDVRALLRTEEDRLAARRAGPATTTRATP